MIKHCCDKMAFFIVEGKVPIHYVPKFREYAIELYKPKTFQDLYYCPWCGRKLPKSLRDRWFDYLENSIDNFAGTEDRRIPEEFLGETWWVSRNIE